MDVVEEIKRRINLAEYIGRHTPLQRAGRQFKALCPFHSEKTASFYVYPERGSWRCFGSCAEGGDLFAFVQKRENLDFKGALRQLAEEAGVELSPEAGRRRSAQDRLAAVTSAAVDFYERQLAGPDAEAARRYLHEARRLTDETIASFRLGWAPPAWRDLRDYLLSRGYDERDALAAGLLIEQQDGGQPYDRFRGRVVIPIADERGQYAGFGGRGLAGEEPKYLNSPQTPLFDKGHTLFGLHLATPAIRETGTVVIVEGYMDVIGPWQAGFRNVVATMGTALTEHHVALLRRLGRRLVLALDPDAAGMAATERAGGLFLGLGSPAEIVRSARSVDAVAGDHPVEIMVAALPAGKDPDELALDDPEAWERTIAGAVPFVEFLLRRLIGKGAPGSANPVEARETLERARPVLLSVRDPIERARYVQRVARYLNVDEAAVMARLRQATPRSRPHSAGGGDQGTAAAIAGTRSPDDEEALLVLLLRHPELRLEFRTLPVGFFTAAEDRELFRRWLDGEDLSVALPDDPQGGRLARLRSRLLPPLTAQAAGAAVSAKVRQVVRLRFSQQLAAVTENVAEAEGRLGARRLAEVAMEAWLGAQPSDELRTDVETVIEDLELGMSIHRHEDAAS